ncbi:transposase domain-containing protein [Anditalea andensis]|uniref:Transposase IS66 C-terminal domain-containing protein n=1 Tax=Anditalea andensis TaxID=1048983 RepID=A0A074KYN6_9BACT|nr:hypothetical protein EL17_18500 [Anditalea andensis]
MKFLFFSYKQDYVFNFYRNNKSDEVILIWDEKPIGTKVKPFTVGRKAYLFAGSHDAAEMTAAMYSFMASCKKNKINEFEWLRDVFERIHRHKRKDLYQLLPSNWEEYRLK